MLRHIAPHFHTLLLYPAARLIVSVLSERQRWKTIRQKPKVHFETPYDGRRIMLLALYEKGKLRPDVSRLLKTARNEGLYILAVNTLALEDPKSCADLIDCYIERPNFGRDFGSYKTGFLYIFQKGWHEQCARLLMINDSIYFAEASMPQFLSDMMNSHIEVLGSTENYEIEYHLGSFCISMAKPILQKKLFQDYWQKYRPTDVRPRVIKQGEMRLSRTLKKCVSSSNQLCALYGTPSYLSKLNSDPELIDFSIRNARSSTLVDWDRFAPEKVHGLLKVQFITPINPTNESLDLRVNTNLDVINASLFIDTGESIIDYLKRCLQNPEKLDTSIANDALISELTRIFMQGSQIHQNASTLLKMGLPIVKLDGIYRGMLNFYDVQRISKLLAYNEATELQTILMARPFGGKTLTGWKRAAFMSGLI